ncbi:unnamed protein product [Ixodes persulcatus]
MQHFYRVGHGSSFRFEIPNKTEILASEKSVGDCIATANFPSSFAEISHFRPILRMSSLQPDGLARVAAACSQVRSFVHIYAGFFFLPTLVATVCLLLFNSFMVPFFFGAFSNQRYEPTGPITHSAPFPAERTKRAKQTPASLSAARRMLATLHLRKPRNHKQPASAPTRHQNAGTPHTNGSP